MKTAYLIALLLSTMTQALAQNNNLENLQLPLLKQRLAESRKDTDRVKLQITLGHALLTDGGQKATNSAFEHGIQAEKLSVQLTYGKGVVRAMLLKAESLIKSKDSESGLKIARQALALAQNNNDKSGKAEAYILIAEQFKITDPLEIRSRVRFYSNAIHELKEAKENSRLAVILKRQADLLLQLKQKEAAIKLLFESLNINKSIGNPAVQETYCLIGRTSLDFADYPNAIKYLLLAVKTANEVRDTSLVLCGIYNSLAITYINLADYKRAIPHSLRALQIANHYKDTNDIGSVSMVLATSYARTNRIKEAVNILNGVKKLAKDDRDLLIVFESYLINLVYAKQYQKAEFYTREVIRLLEKMPPNDATRAPGYHYLTQYFLATKQIRQAYVYLDLYAGIVRKANLTKAIMLTERYYYKLDSLNGNLKPALNHHLAALKIKDSIDNVTKAYQISLLHIENETEEKIKNIDTLTKQAQVKDAQLERNHLIQKITIGGTVLLLIITALIYSRYRLKLRNNAQLLLQKAEIDQQNISLKQLVSDKNQLIVEKDLLLKEVNHRVKNNLQIVMSLLASQSGYMQNEKAQEVILESQNRVRAIALIHDTLYNTDKIAEIELSAYISELIGYLDESINTRNDKVSIAYEVDEILLDVSQAIPLGIILNEAVTNALKYAFPGARCGDIRVMVKCAKGMIEMLVRDNGIGLPANLDLQRAKSLGMTLIKGLTQQLNGELTIADQAGVSIALKFLIVRSGDAGSDDCSL